MHKPLCFILMPQGIHRDETGKEIDFDKIYEGIIQPAIEEAGMIPSREDNAKTGDMPLKPLFERLLLCEYAVIDLSSVNADIMFELGIRHAVRPHKTVLIFDGKTQLPFDLANLRDLPYFLNQTGGLENRKRDKQNLKKQLEATKKIEYTDSPLFQLFDELEQQILTHEKTDIFRELVDYSKDMKEKLKKARKEGVKKVTKIEKELGDLRDVETGILIDLLLSYRAVKAWDQMIALVKKMPPPLAQRIMIQEQLGMALNRIGKSDEAEEVLLQVIKRKGPTSENQGILGRVYKDRWHTAVSNHEEVIATEYLAKAIESYIKGFEADWRDFYPGINAITLLDIKDPSDPRKAELMPLVSYAVKQKMKRETPGYWINATCLELAVLASDKKEANKYLEKSLTSIKEKWEPETTAGNLELIIKARDKRGEETDWIKDIAKNLLKKAGD